MGYPDEATSTRLSGGSSMSLSTSLAEARQLYQILGDVESQLDSVDAKAKQTKISYADLYNVMQDVFTLVNQMGLPPDVEQGIMRIQRLIMAANSLRIALIALDAATATSPVGWALIGLAFTASFIAGLAQVGAAINMRQR